MWRGTSGFRGAQVAYGGQWSPATSNSFSQMALLQLRAFADDYQEPLSSSLQNATVESAVLLGPANRRLLQQVRLPHSAAGLGQPSGTSVISMNAATAAPSQQEAQLSIMHVSGLGPVAQQREV